MSFEGGTISLEITPMLREQLKDWNTVKATYEAADNSSPSRIFPELNDIPWKQPNATSLDVLVLNHGQTILKDPDTLVTQMDAAGYRPLTLPELMALGITRPEFNKRSERLITYEKHTLEGDLRTPCLDFDNGKRNLHAHGVNYDWRIRYRFLFVRK